MNTNIKTEIIATRSIIDPDDRHASYTAFTQYNA